MDVPPPGLQGMGRYDDVLGADADSAIKFGTLYVGETPYATFLETLQVFRRRLSDVRKIMDSTVVEAEIRQEFLEKELLEGRITESWASFRILANARINTIAPVFDLINPAAVQIVREQLAPTLIALGLDDLDFSHMLSDNRPLTQAISRWIWSMTNDSGQPLFSGIRYPSRFDPESICLVLYENRYVVDGDIDIQPITAQTPGFAAAATTLRLHIA